MDLTDNRDPRVRYRYAEPINAAGGRAMIYDPENEDAWIRSTRVVPVSDLGSTRLGEVMEHDPDTGSYHLTYDWRASEPLSMLIVTAVADIAADSPMDMEPLYEQIDPDALDRLFSPKPDGSLGAAGPVTFTFHGHEVTVKRHGHVVISRRRNEE